MVGVKHTHTVDVGANSLLGDIIRIGPNSISFNSPSANAQINAVSANTVKTTSYNAMSPTPGGANTISVSDKEVHGFKRRIVSQVLSQAGLKAIEGRILQHVDDLVAYLGTGGDQVDLTDLEDSWSPPIDVASVSYTHLTLPTKRIV